MGHLFIALTTRSSLPITLGGTSTMQQCSWEGFRCLLWSGDYFADVSLSFFQWHCVWPVFLTDILFHHPISGMAACKTHPYALAISYSSLFSISASALLTWIIKTLTLGGLFVFLLVVLCSPFCSPASYGENETCLWGKGAGWECPSSWGHVLVLHVVNERYYSVLSSSSLQWADHLLTLKD